VSSVYSCNLTSQKYSLSPLEEDYFTNRNLEMPNYCEIERLRLIFATLPLPDFNSNEIFTNTLPLLNSCSFDIVGQETKTVPNDFYENLYSVKENYLTFLSEFDFSKIKNNGDPLLYGSYNTPNCLECNFCIDCSNCYDCISCYECKDVFFSRLANSCRSSYFLDNCYDCENCLFCSNLSNAKFHVFNKEVSEAEYFSVLNSLNLNEATRLYTEKERFQHFLKNQPFFQIYCEGGFSLGFPCKESDDLVSFASRDCESCSTIFFGSNLRGCFGSGFLYGKLSDCFSSGLVVGEGNNIRRSIGCYGKLKNLDLSIACSDSHDLYACVGLQGKSYCIFNYQFRRDEYLKIRKEIEDISIDEGTSSYFLPTVAKLIPYNKSLSSVLFPLNKVQSELMGYSWDTNEDAVSIPTVNKQEEVCEIKGIPFKIPERQILFCKENGLALPTRCPLQRFEERLSTMAPANMNLTKCSISGAMLKVWSSESREFLGEDLRAGTA